MRIFWLESNTLLSVHLVLQDNCVSVDWTRTTVDGIVLTCSEVDHVSRHLSWLYVRVTLYGCRSITSLAQYGKAGFVGSVGVGRCYTGALTRGGLP